MERMERKFERAGEREIVIERAYREIERVRNRGWVRG